MSVEAAPKSARKGDLWADPKVPVVEQFLVWAEPAIRATHYYDGKKWVKLINPDEA